jgi:type II secretory pathway pseudopilin PulG
MRLRLLASRGITMLEVVLMLTATSALAAALMPTLTATIRHAEIAKANTDMTNIRDAALACFQTDMVQAPTINGAAIGTLVEILVTDGDIPRQVSATGSAEWQRLVDNVGGLVDFLERHIVTNNPRGNAANAYSTVDLTPWRGAYMNAPIDPDPWGNRYAINSEWAAGGPEDVVVFSAGPDEEIDSAYAANGLTAGDDDLVLLVQP